MIKHLGFAAIILFSACSPNNEKKTEDFEPEYPFLDYRLGIDERSRDLVSRLSLEEKVAQMQHSAPAIERLNIPAYNWWNECLHGVARNGLSTVFPQAIGLAATFDEELILNIASAIGDEARAKFEISKSIGNRGQYAGLTFWTPNVNIFRDPRWGRGQETYGEDPLLTSRIGTAFVKGLQGDDPEYLKAAACAKHFVVHSGPERERHVFNAIASPKDMAETYLPAFKALNDANVEGFMCAYNRTNSEACCGSSELLTGILRDEWGFDGYITSDCGALKDIYKGHKLKGTPEEAAALALKSGVNLNCGSLYYPHLINAVKQGLIDESEIDASLETLLKTRFRLGLFDPEEKNPFKDIRESVIDSEEHRALALDAARKSMVLLKNNGVLPLSENIASLYLLGPNAGNVEVLLGNYYGLNGEMSTFIEGILSNVSKGTTVQYKQGFLLDRENPNPIDWTTGEAGRQDATIVFAGISGVIEGEEGESIASEYFGDRGDYGLPDNQVAYLKKLRSQGDKPLILVITAGSPIDIAEIYDYADAIIYAWYPGEEGGNAFADILFGDFNPSGRLPVTFPKSYAQLPDYDDYSMKGRTYRYMTEDPFLPFGFGLSYSHYSYDNFVTDADFINKEGSVKLSVDLKNEGPIAGEEVVQLYISYPEELKDAPFFTLLDFKRVKLIEEGDAKVEFSLNASDFRSVDKAGNKVLVSGEYTLWIGGSSPLNRSKELGIELLKTKIEVR